MTNFPLFIYKSILSYIFPNYSFNFEGNLNPKCQELKSTELKSVKYGGLPFTFMSNITNNKIQLYFIIKWTFIYIWYTLPLAQNYRYLLYSIWMILNYGLLCLFLYRCLCVVHSWNCSSIMLWRFTCLTSIKLPIPLFTFPWIKILFWFM